MTKQKFDEFVLAHGRDILWFCRMTAGNAHEGDELYQDTMLTLLEHLDRLDEKITVKVMHFLWQSGSGKSQTKICMADADCTTGELRSTYTKRRGSIGNPECRSGSTGIAGGNNT